MPGSSSFIVANVPLNAQYTILAPSSALNNRTAVLFPTDRDQRCPHRNRKFDDYDDHPPRIIPIIDVKPLPILNLNNNFQDDDYEDSCNRPYYLDLNGNRVYY